MSGVLESRALVAAMLVLLCGLVATAAMQPIRNGDIGWHLAIGRTIARTGEVPREETYTYTARGAPMVAHEWLSQRLYWEITDRFGIPDDDEDEPVVSGVDLANDGSQALYRYAANGLTVIVDVIRVETVQLEHRVLGGKLPRGFQAGGERAEHVILR